MCVACEMHGWVGFCASVAGCEVDGFCAACEARRSVRLGATKQRWPDVKWADCVCGARRSGWVAQSRGAGRQLLRWTHKLGGLGVHGAKCGRSGWGLHRKQMVGCKVGGLCLRCARCTGRSVWVNHLCNCTSERWPAAGWAGWVCTVRNAQIGRGWVLHR